VPIATEVKNALSAPVYIQWLSWIHDSSVEEALENLHLNRKNNNALTLGSIQYFNFT
jgi:hypothetical protein